MDLLEHQGKELLAEYGISIPRGLVVGWSNLSAVPSGANHFSPSYAVKAQIPSGNRHGAGGVTIVPQRELHSAIESLLGKNLLNYQVHSVLVEEALTIERELYVSLVVDRSKRCISFLFSEQGGTDIQGRRETVYTYDRFLPDPSRLLEDWGDLPYREELIRIVQQLFLLMHEQDALLVEINPLVLTPAGQLVALDAKITIDDNALSRHPRFHPFLRQTSEERKAALHGLSYVDLQGTIGIIGNGAGLVMSIIDTLTLSGGRPANFLDLGGGADAERMAIALEIVLSKKTVRGLFICIFGGITHCDELAQSLMKYRTNHKNALPLVVRMVGTNETEARKIFAKKSHAPQKILFVDSLETGCKEIIRLVQDNPLRGRS